MVAMLIIWLMMSKRQLGELSPFDFTISITVGTVAGAGIVDPRIELSRTIVALVMLGLLQVTISWLGIKFRAVQKKVHFDPVVLIENGQLIKKNLLKVRMTIEMVLQLLREKDVFDITEVELAVFEPQGKLSVLRKTECLPVTPRQLQLTVTPNRVLIPIILEGELQVKLLQKLGFSTNEIEEFHQQYKNHIDDVFVAFMDKQHNLHVTSEKVEDTGFFMH